MFSMASSKPPSSGDAVSTGTTIMAVVYGTNPENGGVIVGADSRTSTGTYVTNRVSDKLTPVHDSIYCCRSGSAADTQAVSDMVRHYLNQHSITLGEPPLVKTAAHLFGTICYSNKDRLSASIICAGWDKSDGGSVYCVPLGGACMKQPYAIGGSGSTYIYGLADAKFKEGMTKDECKVFVSTCISHAMSRDGSSGGIIRMAVIDKERVERLYLHGDMLPYNEYLGDNECFRNDNLPSPFDRLSMCYSRMHICPFTEEAVTN